MRSIFITEHGITVKRQGESFLITKEGKAIQRIPVVDVSEILIFGSAHTTSGALHLAAKKSIPVAYIGRNGNLKFFLNSERAGNAVLLRRQFQKSGDQEYALKFSQSVVKAKIENMSSLVSRQRNSKKEETHIDRLKGMTQKVENAKNLASLRGIEGSATAMYFRIFSTFLSPWSFKKRISRPSPDPINSMLSLGYTFLYNTARGFITMRGLNPYEGFFHQNYPGHACLASDMIEEFRAVIVDSVVLKIIKNNMIKKNDFSVDKGLCRINKKGLRIFIEQYVKRINSEITLEENKINYGQILIRQINHLEQSIRQDQPYIPFSVRLRR